MNIALIFAGGTGRRMQQTGTPKQFLELYGKPIIIYTLEKFEANRDVDGIVVVCLEAYIEHMQGLIERYRIRKAASVVPGDATGQLSIYRGLQEVVRLYGEDAITLVHDGVRPLVADETISSCIACAKERGNAITVVPAQETILLEEERATDSRILDRKHCMMARAPQTFAAGELLSWHRKVLAEGKTDFIDSASLAEYCGAHLCTVEGTPENIKITTPIDYYIFKAILSARENSDVFGL